MKIIATIFGFFASAMAVCLQPAAAQSTKHIAARVEMHPIASVTQTDTQFLAGSVEGKLVTVVGELRLAQGNPANKQPAIILMHGSSGVGPNMEPWTAMFNETGCRHFRDRRVHGARPHHGR